MLDKASQTFKMPCLCYNSKKKLMIEGYCQLSSILGNYKFRCFVSQDCTKEMLYIELMDPKKHLNECNFQQFRCNQCFTLVHKYKRAAHILQCDQLKKKCLHCEHYVPSFRFSDHLAIVHRDFGVEDYFSDELRAGSKAQNWDS